jgi:hypothetical protein
MKYLLIISVVLCLAFGFALINMDNANKKLQLEIRYSNQQIAELQKTVELQKAEIESLKNTKTANAINIPPVEKVEQPPQETIIKPQENVEEPIREVNQPVYGIYLGEFLDSLDMRCDLEPDETHKTYGDSRLAKFWWVVQTDIRNNRLEVVTYNQRVFIVRVHFRDSSKTNYSVIMEELQKKYISVESVENKADMLGERFSFITSINSVKVEIGLEHSAGEELTLTYTHIPLAQMCQEEIKEQKADRVKDNL